MTILSGLPLHPLVVHAAVVLLPLAALGVIVLALVPGWRKRYSGLVVLLALAALAVMPLATETGEELMEIVGSGGQVAQHAELGESAPAIALLNVLGALGIWWTVRRKRIGNAVGRRLAALIAVFAVVSASVAIVQIIRIGHSGAQSTWGGIAALAAAEGD